MLLDNFLPLLFVAVPVLGATKSKPNIVFILADDVGWNDFSFHGSDQIQTPNIDALAYNGVILHHHYVQPICTPTRSALMTGRYPSNYGMQGSPLGVGEPRSLPEGKLLPQYLKDLGYSTHLVGKWHLGYHKKEFTPLSRGFDSFLGYYTGLISYYDHLDQAALKDGSTFDCMDLHRNYSSAWDLSGRYATDIFTEEAESIIRNHDSSTPFFLYLAHLAAHAGLKGKLLEAPQEIINKFSHITEPNRRTYAAMIYKLDESVGRVVKALQEAQILDNTVIVLVSDNGAPTTSRMYQNWGSNLPFRGVKGTQWEGAVRTPALIWGAHLSRQVSHELMHVTDWLPTLISAAGGPQVEDDFDGVDQWGTIQHRHATQRTNALLEFDEVQGVYAVRDGNWKLTQGSVSGNSTDDFIGKYLLISDNPEYNITAVLNSDVGNAISQVNHVVKRESEILNIREEVTIKCPQRENMAPCVATSNEPCLFDLSQDPCEMNNVAAQYPKQVQNLQNLLGRYWTTHVDQLNKPTDLNANPKRFNNTCVPWMES